MTEHSTWQTALDELCAALESYQEAFADWERADGATGGRAAKLADAERRLEEARRACARLDAALRKHHVGAPR